MSASAQEGKGTHQLQAILPDWCALSWQHALICFTFLVLFLHFCYLPLPTGQIWHEVANGSTIVNSGIASADPALPYSDGVRALKTNWLGQALVYWTYHFGGPEWLSCMFALVQIATLAIWAFLFQRVSGRRWTALLVAPIVLASSIDVNTLGSSSFALLIFALTALTILGNSTLSRSESRASEIVWSNASIWRWLAVIGLFVLWANLDVSVLVGVGLLGALALSRLVTVLTSRSGTHSIMGDREVHHRTWLFEICLIATLIQPSGLGFWQAIFWSSNNPIVHGLGGWSPVAIASYRGLWIAIAWLGWIVASRRTSSIPLWNVAAAILLTTIVACFETQIVWFATTMCFLAVALLPKLNSEKQTSAARNEIKQFNPEATASQANSKPALKFAFTLVCGLLVWMAFSLSPIGTMAMSGKPRSTAQLFGSNTPLGATQFLTENRPAKIVWTPKYWADHLQVNGQPTPVMANLNEALLTPRIEKDYQSIYYGGKNWQRLLRRYQIDDLVVDKENQTDLMRELRVNSGQLEKVFEDHLCVVYRRNSKSMQTPTTQGSSTRSTRSSNRSISESKKTDVKFTDSNISQPPIHVQKNDVHETSQLDLEAELEEVRFHETAKPTKRIKGRTVSSKRKPSAARLFGDQSPSTKSISGD